MAEISTLVEDIYLLLRDNKGELTNEQLAKFGANCARHIGTELVPSTRKRPDEYTVYPSELGHACPRKVAFSILLPEEGIPLEPWVKYKFIYGDLVEESVLVLAKAAGHEVTREQESVKFSMGDWTVSGRIDCFIDGVLVDVKSCSEYAFKDYANNGITTKNDKFGYLTQMRAYQFGTGGIPHLNDDSAGWLLVNKGNGMMALTYITGVDQTTWLKVHQQFLEAVDKEKAAIKGGYDLTIKPPMPDVPEGVSGNRRLDTVCSYCQFKRLCWPHARAFLYAKGPVYLTKVVKEPNVPEVVI